LATYPHNDEKEVLEFLEAIKIDPNQAIEIEKLADTVPELPPTLTWK